MGTREHEGKTYITLRVASVTLGGKSEASQPVQQPAAPRQQPPAGYQPQIGQPMQQRGPAEPNIDFDDDIPF
jgi:hypothetical protein